jgi:hypothetical protein
VITTSPLPVLDPAPETGVTVIPAALKLAAPAEEAAAAAPASEA